MSLAGDEHARYSVLGVSDGRLLGTWSPSGIDKIRFYQTRQDVKAFSSIVLECYYTEDRLTAARKSF